LFTSSDHHTCADNGFCFSEAFPLFVNSQAAIFYQGLQMLFEWMVTKTGFGILKWGLPPLISLHLIIGQLALRLLHKIYKNNPFEN
jgi:hypothetical protein